MPTVLYACGVVASCAQLEDPGQRVLAGGANSGLHAALPLLCPFVFCRCVADGDAGGGASDAAGVLVRQLEAGALL